MHVFGLWHLCSRPGSKKFHKEPEKYDKICATTYTWLELQDVTNDIKTLEPDNLILT